MIIAIDGPSGAGKSTVAHIIAQKLGFAYLDTGAMYRSVALLALRGGLDLSDDAALGELARTMSLNFEPAGDGTQRVHANGEDVTLAIRTPEVDKAVSPVSAAPSVREAMTKEQQRIGAAGNYVVEGRDIGTTVFPDAELKVFLTASAHERALRRLRQNRERGIVGDSPEAIEQAIIARDAYDSSREASPLCQAVDARLLDSSDLTQDEVVEQILSWVKEL